MEIIKNKTHYLFKRDGQEYHLSVGDYDKLGHEKALEFVTQEIEKKLKNNFAGKFIDFEKARSMGFCEFGIADFCEKLGLNLNEKHEVKKIYDLLDESKLQLLFEYRNEILKIFGVGIFKKNEEAISQDAHYSYRYAREVLKERFEKGEEAISQDALYSYWYAREVLRERFEKGEEAISQDAYYSYRYAREVLKERFEKGEEAISQDAYYAYWYARSVRN